MNPKTFLEFKLQEKRKGQETGIGARKAELDSTDRTLWEAESTDAQHLFLKGDVSECVAVR